MKSSDVFPSRTALIEAIQNHFGLVLRQVIGTSREFDLMSPSGKRLFTLTLGKYQDGWQIGGSAWNAWNEETDS